MTNLQILTLIETKADIAVTSVRKEPKTGIYKVSNDNGYTRQFRVNGSRLEVFYASQWRLYCSISK
jgi:hypothetical protein